MDIIWGSLVIIFICSCLPTPKSRWESLRRTFFVTWFSFRRKFLWMVITIMVPEFVLGAAVNSFIAERKCTKMFKAFQEREKIEDEVDWTPKHSMYANMGGFVVKFPRENEPGTTPDELDRPRQPDQEQDSDNDIAVQWLNQFKFNNNRGYKHVGPFNWNTHSHNFSLAVGSIRRRMIHSSDHDFDTDGEDACARLLSGDTWTLNGLQLLEARRVGIIGQLPSTTEVEIQDKSKSTGVVNALAIFQVSWLIVQLATRAADGRQSSQIEISALAFATCALVAYSLLFHQPKDVQTPTVIEAARAPNDEEYDALTAVGRVTVMRASRQDIYAFPALDMGGDWSALFGLSVFGSVHIAAWNMTFPSYTEQILWKTCAVYITCIPVVFPVIAALSELTNTFPTNAETPSCLRATIWTIVAAFLFLFLPARLFLLVESFRSTYYLPPSSYTATWASNIPHVV